MKCPLEPCAEIFDNELDVNTHVLFNHGMLRPMCSTNIAAKQMQINELMKRDFDQAKHRPDMFLDMYYILWKQHELGIQNTRNLWEFSGKTYINNKGRKVREKVVIPMEQIKHVLDGGYFFESTRAKYYDERYSYKAASPIDIYE